MYILSNRDIELSCDETVVRSFGDTKKSAYARTLISMEEGLHNILQSKTNAELQNESTMDTAIRTEIAALKNRWETPALQIAVEYSFVTLTALASGVENAKLVQSHYTGREKEDPILGNFELTKESNDNNRIAFANLFYQLTYHISDENTLTIGERDRVLAGVINGIQQYWDNTSINTLLTINEDNIVKEIKAIAEKYNNDNKKSNHKFCTV